MVINNSKEFKKKKCCFHHHPIRLDLKFMLGIMAPIVNVLSAVSHNVCVKSKLTHFQINSSY